MSWVKHAPTLSDTPSASPDDPWYTALASRDPRFDGRVWIGVTSTGIYCRPICRVRLPRRENCRFFPHPASAEAHGFRPCLRCRPELAPGYSLMDSPSQLAWAAAQALDAGIGESQGLPALAARLGITDRHLRRIFRSTFGVSPVEYQQTQRLLLAKRLLTDTDWPITDIALASGFGSLRRFHALMQQRYGLSPSAWRRQCPSSPATTAPEHAPGFVLHTRPPFAWSAWLAFLQRHHIAQVEHISADSETSPAAYQRSLRMLAADGTAHTGWLRLSPVPATTPHAVRLQVSASLHPVLPSLLTAVRQFCDLACDPVRIAQALGPLAADPPGLRIPGALDGFEVAVQCVLGQQVSVAAARTLLARLVAAHGEPINTPWPNVERLFPRAATLASIPPAQWQQTLKIPLSRATALHALACAVAQGDLCLSPAVDVARTVAQLQALPGIGPWTAQLIALRCLGWPDAWPAQDAVLRTMLRDQGLTDLAHAAHAWRPWRSYAALYVWHRAAHPNTPAEPLP